MEEEADTGWDGPRDGRRRWLVTGCSRSWAVGDERGRGRRSCWSIATGSAGGCCWLGRKGRRWTLVEVLLPRLRIEQVGRSLR
ncbi:hypothetical protein ACLOJK_013379 [Asimina triloba]